MPWKDQGLAFVIGGFPLPSGPVLRGLTVCCYLAILTIQYVPIQNQLIPSAHRDNVIAHVVTTHNSVGEYSTLFAQKLRRFNYVTPKNYLDYIFTYTKLLEEKDKFILGLVNKIVWQNS